MARAEPQACPRCHREPVVDGHELVRRSQGGRPDDPEMVVVLGRACHEWVTEHPAQAHGEGWALWRHERDDPTAHRAAYLRRLARGTI
jgi:hypothetical protein